MITKFKIYLFLYIIIFTNITYAIHENKNRFPKYTLIQIYSSDEKNILHARYFMLDFFSGKNILKKEKKISYEKFWNLLEKNKKYHSNHKAEILLFNNF
jgi:hypothetical protein